MKYQCIKGYRYNGEPVSPGDVVDMEPAEAAIYVFYKKLVPCQGGVEVRDPVIEHRDPVIKRAGRKPRVG